jgi:hypothetical protein
MKIPTDSTCQAFRPYAWLAAAAMLVAGNALAGGASDIVAVYSSVSPAYVRVSKPGGGYEPETFAFGEGGELGSPMSDLSLDSMHIADIARLMAPALAKQSYIPTDDPMKTDLLVMVYWGATAGTGNSAEHQVAQGSLLPPPPPPPKMQPAGAGEMQGDPSTSGMGMRAAMFNAAHRDAENGLTEAVTMENFSNLKRDQQDIENAKILGYLPELNAAGGARATSVNLRREELVDELEEGRYFVVLMAYDFQLLRTRKQRKLLWEVRFSIRERGHDFGKDVAAMARNASKYFGRDSGGLQRDAYDAKVDIGPIRILGYGEEARK